MSWIEGISWNGSSYGVSTISKSGERKQLPASALHDVSYQPSKSTRRIKVTTDFSSWRTVPGQAFMSAMGFPKDTKSGQQVYAFESDGKTFHIPAVVLMQGLFRPLRTLAPHLFRPQGLEKILVAKTGGEFSVGFFGSSYTTLSIAPSRSPGILEALSWMYCFPSAALMWDSIVVNARVGQLGLTLPRARCAIVLQTIECSGVWMIVDVTISRLHADEDPFEFAPMHKRCIDFHQGCQHLIADYLAAPKKLLIPSRGGEWVLSDEEWTVLEHIVRSKMPMKHDLKSMVDVILEKFGRGIAWRFLECAGSNQPAVVACYQRMLKDGRWDALLQGIKELRCAA